jgi:uncharacterized membrane-anchored protein YhcB (DUF1043 family)
MATEILLLAGLAGIAGLVLGFLAGRLSAPSLRKNEGLRRERDEAQSELDRMREQVDQHFGESARLFSNLAHDYRALYEHFAESAGQLGLSESERREILVSATKPLPTEEAATTPTPVDDGTEQGPEYPAARPEAMATGALNSPEARQGRK